MVPFTKKFFADRLFGVAGIGTGEEFMVFYLQFLSFDFAGGKFPDLLECTIPCMHGKAEGKSISKSDGVWRSR